MLRSDLHGYSYAYILITGVVTVEGANNRDKKAGLSHIKIMHHLFIAFQR